MQLRVREASQQVACPLIGSQEDCSSPTDPPYSRPQACKEGGRSRLVQYLPQHGQHGLLVLGQHHACLQHIQRCGDGGCHGAGQAPQESALYAADFCLPSVVCSPTLQGLPQRELYDGEGDLSQESYAPAAIQLHPHMLQSTGMPLVQDVGEGGQGSWMLAGLGPLLDHLGRNPYRAGSDLTQAGGQHMYSGLPPASPAARTFDVRLALGIAGDGRGRGREVALEGVVGDEEESGAGGGADDGAAHAAVDASEAARLGEAGRGLEAGLEGVEGVQGEIHGGACETAGLVGRQIGSRQP